jgi:hypothetical protein
MNKYANGFKSRSWFMAAVLCVMMAGTVGMAGCGAGDGIFGGDGGDSGGGNPPPPPPPPPVVDPGPAGPPPPLATAVNFGTFGGTAGMTNMGDLTVVNGDIGTTQTATSGVTGFHDSALPVPDSYTELCPTAGAAVGCGLVTGLIKTCTVSTTGPTSAAVNPVACAFATQARLDAQTAYGVLVAKPAGAFAGAGNLSGLTLAPGVYTSATSFILQDGLVGSAGDLTLDAGGNVDAVFVFQMGTSLTVGGPGAAFPRSVNLINGAQAKNVFWQVGSAATINAGGGGTMVGTIISQAGVDVSTAPPGPRPIVTIDGRLLSLGASVTLVNTVIVVP